MEVVENQEEQRMIDQLNPYRRGKIYRITDLTSDKTYIGSTTKKTINIRLSYHKSDYKRYQNGRYGYCSSFDIIMNGNYEIELVALFPCNNKRELKEEEKTYIRLEKLRDDINCVNINF